MNKSVYKRPGGQGGLTSRPCRTDRAAFVLPEVSGPIAVHASSDCHITPPDVAARMVAALDIAPCHRWLEPSAGTGSLVAAVLSAGGLSANGVIVERDAVLADAVEQRTGMLCRRCCFLQFTETPALGQFERIIMNPPFKPWRKHLAAARKLLAPGGRLIALLPITAEVPGSAEIERLDNSTFALVKANTKFILING